MKGCTWGLFLMLAAPCAAQGPCSHSTLAQAAARAAVLQQAFRKGKVEDMDTDVPPAVNEHLAQFKDALNDAADAAVACAPPAVEAAELETQIAQALHANPPEPPENTVISKDDHRFDEVLGSYGHNLRVSVGRPAAAPGLLEVTFSINIECGSDSMLLVYELRNGVWTKGLRWQAPALHEVSDAFGDFFLSAILPAARGASGSGWRVVVAHGDPWCTSRFSGFQMDLLAPGKNPDTPQVVWHINRGYSRDSFAPTLRASGNTFELRLNADAMEFDPGGGFERRVIYRYSVDEYGHIRRIEPIAANARGFVEEWLDAPWTEARGFTTGNAVASLAKVHAQFAQQDKPGDSEFVMYQCGPVRACSQQGTFQVQMDSTLQKMIPGKPGGDSSPLPSHYFHVREVKDGYEMVSAPAEPDPTCAGPNLMPDRE